MIIDNVRNDLLPVGSVSTIHRKIDASKLAEVLVRDVVPHNPWGFTFDPLRNQCLLPGAAWDPSIFIVSLYDYGMKVRRTPDREIWYKWISKQAGYLSRPGYYIGGWRHEGVFFIDMSIRIGGRETAETL